QYGAFALALIVGSVNAVKLFPLSYFPFISHGNTRWHERFTKCIGGNVQWRCDRREFIELFWF
ncbi:MAG: hypothetical protein ACW7DS_00700, partial [Paraglaciecola chathamensis]